MSTPLLAVERLTKHYPPREWWGRGTATVRAVEDVSFEVARGETLALVGESGSGKSTIGRAVVRLEDATAGRIRFDGNDLSALDAAALRRLRRRMQVIFQDPLGALNPHRSVGASIAEALAIHHVVPAPERRERAAALLAEVGLDAAHADRLPREFSGGQRQRIAIARALAVGPDFVVCDEPVSALDVSLQAQVLNLLLDLRARRNLAYLFIAHDLAVVRQVAHRVAVLYLGTLAEIGPVDEVIAAPRHPYTQALVSAVPGRAARGSARRIVLAGEPPSPLAPPPGCPFEPRCFHPSRDALCRASRPPLVQIGGRGVACHHEAATGAA